ncbi:MAG TPA: hypothetical protein VFQ61_27825, partial [Polyangiaceae bacterium]|nr:hypothetical protein [Polyangiaceae bacterium]
LLAIATPFITLAGLSAHLFDSQLGRALDRWAISIGLACLAFPLGTELAVTYSRHTLDDTIVRLGAPVILFTAIPGALISLLALAVSSHRARRLST